MASTAQTSYLASTSNFGLNPAMSSKAATWPPNTSIWSTSGATAESLRITAGEINVAELDSVQTHAQPLGVIDQIVRRSSLSTTSDESDIIAPMRKICLTTPLEEDDVTDLSEACGFTSDEGDEYDLTDGFVVPDTDSDVDSGSSSDEQSSDEEIGSPYFMDDPQANVDDWEDTMEERRLLRQQRLNTKHAFVRYPSKYVEYESGIRSEGHSDDDEGEDEDEDEDEDSGVDSQDDENFINDHNAGMLYLGYR